MRTRAIIVLIVVTVAAAVPLAGGARHVLPGGPQAATGSTDAATAITRAAAASTSIPVADAHASGNTAQAPTVTPQTPTDPPWLAALRTWTGAVAAHRPGGIDAPAEAIGGWPELSLDAVRQDLVALLSILRHGGARGATVTGRNYRGPVVSTDQLLLWLGVTDPVQVNAFVKRAAILHADIAMFVTPRRTDGLGCSSRSTVLVVDGVAVGTGCSNYHWKHARALLDQIEPKTARDGFASRWYHATIVFLLEQTNYSDAQAQLSQARLMLPDDADVWFEHGYYNEALAAPRVQALAGASRSTLGLPVWHLTQAEDAFRRALKRRPDFPEARVRLGAALTRLGRQKDGAAQLRQALETAKDPVLRYYAEIFLARASEGLRDAKAAREHYERAHDLFPSAQAPLLALGQLARSAGDRPRAGKLVRDAIGSLTAGDQKTDLWWQYNLWQSRDAATLLAELYRSIEQENRR